MDINPLIEGKLEAEKIIRKLQAELADAERSIDDLKKIIAQPTNPTMHPWHPMTDPINLKHLGKLCEELGECSSAVSRCIIQGINEKEPVTGKKNKEWLEEEMADVTACIDLVIARFSLNKERMAIRVTRKRKQLAEWHKMA